MHILNYFTYKCCIVLWVKMCIYGIIARGSSYPTSQKPLHILQQKAMRIITFSKFDAHSSPIFKYLTIIKLPDFYVLNIAIFMHKFHHKELPSAFNHYLLQLMKFMPIIWDLLPNNPIHCPKPELISGSSTLDIRGLKSGILFMSLTKNYLIFN